MKVIVAGSRDLEVSADFVVTLLLDHFKCNPTELVAGGCPTGPDEVAKYIARPQAQSAIAKWPNTRTPCCLSGMATLAALRICARK
jgi:hypothetical protein